MNTLLHQSFDQRTVPESGHGLTLVGSEFKTSSGLNENIIRSRLLGSQASLDAALGHIFPDKREETALQLARRIMGDEIKDLSDEEVGTHLTQFHFLLQSWLDEFEREIFADKTLQQILKEG